MPTLTQLEYILAVNRQKHFGRAAQDCNVSQPSLSAQIQKVEDQLELILFDRSKKPVITTESGKVFVKQAQKVLQEHSKLLEINPKKENLKGSFHLGVIPTLSAQIIPLFVEEFSKKFPKVNLNISEYKTEDIISHLYDDRLDAGLLVTPLYDDKVIERSLFLEPFYVFSSENHKLSTKKQVREEDLNLDDIWLLNEGHCFRNQVLKICSVGTSKKVLSNISFESGSLETIINLIRKGKGFTLLPHLATQNLTKKERDTNLKTFRKPVPTREISLVHSRSFLKEDIIEALVDSIITNTPRELKSLKRSQVEVVDI